MISHINMIILIDIELGLVGIEFDQSNHFLTLIYPITLEVIETRNFI